MTRTNLHVLTFSAVFAVCSSHAAAQVGAEPAAQPADNSAAPLGPDADPAEHPAPLIGPPAAGGLTADQAAARAAASSHEARARDEEHAAAEHSIDQASAAFIPRLTGGARYTRQSQIDQPSLGNLVVAPAGTRPGPLDGDAPLLSAPLSFPQVRNQYALDATLEVPLSDYLLKLPQLKAAAEKNAESARLLAQASRLSVATDARVVYYTWARASLQAEVAERALVQAQAHLEDVQTAHAAGSASKADVLAVQSQVASAELGVTRAAAAVELYDRQLHVLLHDRDPAPYQLGEDLRVDPGGTRTGRARDEQALVERAQRTRLEPQALRHGSGALREQASTALAAEVPRLSAVGSVLYAQPNPRIFPQKEQWDATWEAGVRLTWTPTEIFGAAAGREVNLAKARQLDEERAQLEDGIALEVKQQLLALAESEAALVSAQRQVGAAEESYRVRRALFQNGRATSAELTDAENEWSRAQLELIGARIDRRIAEARLVHALGEDVDASAGRVASSK